MDKRQTFRLAAIAAAWMIATSQAMAAILPPPSPFDEFTTKLPTSADSALLLPNGDAIVAVSRSARSVALLGSGQRDVRWSIALPFEPLDADVSADGAHIYLVGRGEPAVVVARVDAADGSMRALALGDAGEITGISVSPRGDIYLADRSMSGVTRLDGDLLAKATPGEPLAVALKEVGRGSLSFKSGIVDVAATDKPGLVFILHEYENAVSVVDMMNQKVIDQLSLATQAFAPSPLTQALSARRGESTKKAPSVTTSAAFGDSGGNRIVVSDLDLGFSSLEIVKTIDLGMDFPASANAPDRRFLVAADGQQNFILVGATASRKVVMFKRQNRTVERVGAIDLPAAPTGIDASANGEVLAFLVDSGTELIVMDRPDSWRALFADSESALAMAVRDIQRMLSILGYPVGVVDGMPGPRTKSAIELFQQSVGLPATGEPSIAVQEALREAVPQGNNFEFKTQDIQTQMRR